MPLLFLLSIICLIFLINVIKVVGIFPWGSSIYGFATLQLIKQETKVFNKLGQLVGFKMLNLLVDPLIEGTFLIVSFTCLKAC